MNLETVSLIDIQQVGNSFQVTAWFANDGDREYGDYKALAMFSDRLAAKDALNEFKRLFPRNTLPSFPTDKAEEPPARSAATPT